MRLIHDPRYYWRDDASNLTAELIESKGAMRLRVWCDHCGRYHFHGPMPGHRESHCHDVTSPYEGCGYNLVGIAE